VAAGAGSAVLSPTPLVATQTAVPSPHPAGFPGRVGFSPNLPEALIKSFKKSGDLSTTSDPEKAAFKLSSVERTRFRAGFMHWLPLSTLADGVSLNDLLDFWNAKPANGFPAQKLFVNAVPPGARKPLGRIR